MRFTIAGAGAIGSLWAIQLSKAGHQVQLWTRDEKTTDWRQLESEPQHSFTCNNRKFLSQSDCILVTVKAFQVVELLSDIAANIHPDALLMIMHNGMGTETTVAKKLPKNPMVYATTTHGCLRLSEHVIRHTGLGKTLLGAMNSKAQQCSFLADVLDHALPPCQWSDDIAAALWDKLSINCVINPLTALHQVNNGHLLDPSFESEITSLCQEITAVMGAEGIHTSVTQLVNQVFSVASATATNYSSMNRDIHFRRQSEIDYINGYLITRAKSHSIAVPCNEKLWHAIKQLEQNYDNA
ncbi:2-dehydropantoate 2-reductase [Veronia pacifica]|uniref:2-dehydropantoate 2-reductase n=1 Tax=Veronia pacifica TaxID=1080227 RepID=A0A1C3EFA4_9GAMM|nr:2-dehydropantoate 2-reductase [Veronia pacifica]ODA31899.1 2-dehydropantoate 2-reductase [Veronia pacifica]